jgi:hypothetical protein
MKLIKIITILLIYILITLIVTKIHYKQYDYFTTKYGYLCTPCGECETGKYLDGCSGTNEGTCRDMYYVVPDVDQNSEVANRVIRSVSQSSPEEEYCKNNLDNNACGNCNTRALDCEDSEYLDGCGVNGSSGECKKCTCPDGQYKLGCGGLQAGVCEPCNAFDCVEGQYLIGCSGNEAGGCQQCPSNMTSPAGSNSVEACQCEEGYSGPDGGPCTACLAGFYKTGVGNGSCLPCEEGSFNENEGSGECQQCPDNMTSPYGSDSEDNCECVGGYEYIGGVCTQCQAGFYKTRVGNSPCLPCEAGKYKANIGVGTCAPCEAGKYTANTGAGTCAPCEAGSFNENEGSDECQQCPDNMTSPLGSVSDEECQCEEGYSGPDGGPCTKCQPGFYKTGVGNGSCLPCQAGSFNENEGSGECQQCPDNMTSPTRSDSEDDCVCDKGYEYIDRECRACQEGWYKDTIDNDTCTICSSNHSPSGKYYHDCGGDTIGTLTECAYDSCETDEYLYGCGKSNSGICRKCNTKYITEGPTYGRTHYYPTCGDGILGPARECSEYSRWNNCSNNQYFWGCIGVNDGNCYSCADRCSQGEVAIGCGNGRMGRCESCSDIEEDFCYSRSDGRTTLYGCGGQYTGYCGCPDGMYWAWRDRVCRWRN